MFRSNGLSSTATNALSVKGTSSFWLAVVNWRYCTEKKKTHTLLAAWVFSVRRVAQRTSCNQHLVICAIRRRGADVLPQLHHEQQAGKYLQDAGVYGSSFDCCEYNSANCRGGEFLQERDTSSSTWLQPINYAYTGSLETKQADVSPGLPNNPPTGESRIGFKAPDGTLAPGKERADAARIRLLSPCGLEI